MNTTRTEEAASSKTTRRGRLALALCAVVLSSLSVTTISSGTPAGAIEFGGTGALVQIPGLSQPTAGCTRGFTSVRPMVSVDNGYTGGQYVSYRVHVYNDRGLSQGWNFSAPKLVPHNGYHLVPLTEHYINAALNSRNWVYVQVARWRWNGSSWGWQYSGWQEASYTGYAGVAINQCFT